VVLTDVSLVNGLTASTNSEITVLNLLLHVGYGSALNLTRNLPILSLASVFPSPVLNLTLAQRIDLFLSFTLSDLISGVPSTHSLLSLKTYSSHHTSASSFGNQCYLRCPPGSD
jgi:hypothetical protein